MDFVHAVGFRVIVEMLYHGFNGVKDDISLLRWTFAPGYRPAFATVAMMRVGRTKPGAYLSSCLLRIII